MLSRSQRARRGVAELGGFAETQTPKQPLTLGRRVPMSKMNVPKTNIKKEAHAYRRSFGARAVAASKDFNSRSASMSLPSLRKACESR